MIRTLCVLLAACVLLAPLCAGKSDQKLNYHINPQRLEVAYSEELDPTNFADFVLRTRTDKENSYMLLILPDADSSRVLVDDWRRVGEWLRHGNSAAGASVRLAHLNGNKKTGFPEARRYLDVKEMPRVLFFSQGKFMRYASFLPLTFEALKSFVDGGYQSYPRMAIPSGPSFGSNIVHFLLDIYAYYWDLCRNHGVCERLEVIGVIAMLFLGFLYGRLNDLYDENTSSQQDANDAQATVGAGASTGNAQAQSVLNQQREAAKKNVQQQNPAQKNVQVQNVVNQRVKK